jgi:pilus assembly protein CpaE
VTERILIVDDDRDSLKLIGLMLQRRGYQISAAQNGMQALAKAESEMPDLIILDVMMPDLDGFEVCRRLRANPKTAHTPIIMFTAKTQVNDKVLGFQAGADDYLTKPIHPAELSSRVEAVLLRSARARETAPTVTAHAVGFIGSKGGVGTTTLATNVAVALAQQEVGQGKRMIVVELAAGSGGAGLQLGFSHPGGLSTLMTKPVEELDVRTVESYLTPHASGARMLLAPTDPRSSPLPVPQVEATIQQLGRLCDFLVLDLGVGLDDATRVAVKQCRYVFLVTEPQRVALALAQALIADLATIDVPREKIGLVLCNRAHSATTITKSAVEGLLGEVVSVIPPVPEMAFQAVENAVPLYLMQPGSVVSNQIRDLAKLIMSK